MIGLLSALTCQRERTEIEMDAAGRQRKSRRLLVCAPSNAGPDFGPCFTPKRFFHLRLLRCVAVPCAGVDELIARALRDGFLSSRGKPYAPLILRAGQSDKIRAEVIC